VETEIPVTYTPEVVRAAALAVWRHGGGMRNLLLMAGVATFFIVSTAVRAAWTPADVGLAVLAGLAVVMPLFTYRMLLGQGMARFHAMGGTTARLSVDADGLRLVTVAGAAEIPWEAVRAVSTSPSAWVLFLARSAYLSLPGSDLPDAVRAEIRARVTQHGGRVQ
jgi:hypothetical protein